MVERRNYSRSTSNGMYNLLPEETQKHLLKEYRLRFLALLCGFFSAAFIIGAVLLLPSYIFVFEKKAELEQELEMLKKGEEAGAKGFSTSARAVEDKIKALATLDKGVEEPHAFFSKIIEERDKSIFLQRFSYEIVGTTTSLIVDGVAKTRDDLLAFQNRLERRAPFHSAEFPVELLAKSRDIRFSIIIR